MSFQAVFKRYEIKYLISKEQKEALFKIMEQHMKLDQYGRTTIKNIYYDTGLYLLARRSAEKPVFKEKLRVRSYGRATLNDTVFVELKRKYDSVVYKRRIAFPQLIADDWLINGVRPNTCTQIENEISYFLEFYKTLEPKMFLSYEREAFYALDGSDFRITFDENILARDHGFSFDENEPIRNDCVSSDKDKNGKMEHKASCRAASNQNGGLSLLEDGVTLMELKTSGAIPLWLVKFLSENHIYKTSFSKYGTAYNKIILGKKGEMKNVC